MSVDIELSWTRDDLKCVMDNDDLHIAPYRPDGATPGTPTWIWAVVVDGELYVRAYNGQNSRWYRAAKEQGMGQISLAGTTRDVAFKPLTGSDDFQVRIDDAYHTRYAGSPYLDHMVGAASRTATLRITPRGT